MAYNYQYAVQGLYGLNPVESLLSNLDPYSVLTTDGQGNFTDLVLSNGQLLIGQSGSYPIANTLGVSANLQQTLGAGSISLDTIQNIQTNSSPTFAALTLSGLNVGVPVITTTGGLITTGPINLASSSFVSGILPVLNGGSGTSTPGLIAGTNIAAITGTWPNQTISTVASPTFTNITGTLLTAAQPNITSVGTLTALSVSGVLTNSHLGLGIVHSSSGGVFTSSLVSLTADVTGVLPVANVGISPGTGINISGAGVISVASTGVVDSIIPGTNIAVSGPVGNVTVSTVNNPTFSGLVTMTSGFTSNYFSSVNGSGTQGDVLNLVGGPSASNSAVQMTFVSASTNRMIMSWDTVSGCRIFDANNNSTWLTQGGTTAGYVESLNNILDDGIGNVSTRGYVTFPANPPSVPTTGTQIYNASGIGFTIDSNEIRMRASAGVGSFVQGLLLSGTSLSLPLPTTVGSLLTINAATTVPLIVNNTTGSGNTDIELQSAGAPVGYFAYVNSVGGGMSIFNGHGTQILHQATSAITDNSLLTVNSVLDDGAGNVTFNATPATNAFNFVVKTNGSNTFFGLADYTSVTLQNTNISGAFGNSVMAMVWDSSNGCRIYDWYNNHTWLTQGGTTPGQVQTSNSTLDNGSGVMTINASSSPCLFINQPSLSAGSGNHMVTLASTAYTNSYRNSIEFATGSANAWEIGTDSTASKTTDFYLYCDSSSTYGFKVSQTGTVSISTLSASVEVVTANVVFTGSDPTYGSALTSYNSGSNTSTWTGYNNMTVTTVWKQVNNMVHIWLYAVTVSSGTSGFNFNSGTILPLVCQPVSRSSFSPTAGGACLVTANNVGCLGFWTVFGGSITIAQNSGSGARTTFNTGICGWTSDIHFMYQV